MLKLLSHKVRESAADHIEDLVVSLTRHFHAHLGSPIEAVLFEALVMRQFCLTGQFPKLIVAGREHPGESGTIITPQAIVGRYRLDFLIQDRDRPNLKIAVECDGHDFYERTKEKARKDRFRDRDLQAMGFLVLRYTGSEIMRDPWACAEDICIKAYERFSTMAAA